MCQNGLKILLRAIVRHGPKTGDLPSVWLDTCGSLPYQPDALARVAASPSQGFAGSKASPGQALFRSKRLCEHSTSPLVVGFDKGMRRAQYPTDLTDAQW